MMFLVTTDGDGGFTISCVGKKEPMPEEIKIMFKVGLGIAKALHKKEYEDLGISEADFSLMTPRH